jgi:hypothetical protein
MEIFNNSISHYLTAIGAPKEGRRNLFIFRKAKRLLACQVSKVLTTVRQEFVVPSEHQNGQIGLKTVDLLSRAGERGFRRIRMD